jgi:hypothetical protein
LRQAGAIGSLDGEFRPFSPCAFFYRLVKYTIPEWVASATFNCPSSMKNSMLLCRSTQKYLELFVIAATKPVEPLHFNAHRLPADGVLAFFIAAVRASTCSGMNTMSGDNSVMKPDNTLAPMPIDSTSLSLLCVQSFYGVK